MKAQHHRLLHLQVYLVRLLAHRALLVAAHLHLAVLQAQVAQALQVAAPAVSLAVLVHPQLVAVAVLKEESNNSPL